VKRYCPKCRKAAEWKKGERPRDPRKPHPKVVEKGLICSRCGYFIKPERLKKLYPVKPILTEKQRNCDHDFEDVTEERRKLIAGMELPKWAKVLVEEKDPRWVNQPEKWRFLNYLKCGNCGLFRIVDQL